MVGSAENAEASYSSKPVTRSKSGLWRWGKNLLTVVFLALVVWLLINHARELDWGEVNQALDSYTWINIAIGILLALSTYIAYSGYDVLARYMIGHRVPIPTTMTIAYICCAFTLNLGALIGSLGFRYRLYSQYGVSKGNIARIVGVLITTNWLGYIALAGVVFVSGAVVVPSSWEIGDLGLRILGGAFLAVVVSYLLLSLFSPKRTLEIRGQTITLPSIKIAVFQLALSCSHWALMAAVIYSFLYTEIGYFSLLGVLLISAIAGIIAHVPGALGVLEAVFIALLGGEINPAILVAALIAYRVVFYLLPLAIAGALYLFTEVVAKKSEPV